MIHSVASEENELYEMILDCTSYSRPCLAEYAEGTRAICSALSDICWFSEFNSAQYDSLKDQVTIAVIEVASNLKLDSCQSNFAVLVSYKFNYLKENILTIIKKHTSCKFKIRDNHDAVL
jgi:hypothetical protein